MIQRWIVVVLALTLFGCASGDFRFRFRIFAHTPPPPSFDTVVNFLWLDGDDLGECKARSWLEHEGMSDADIEEWIIRARLRTREIRDECLGRKVGCPGYR
jgi:hypothetical protein